MGRAFQSWRNRGFLAVLLLAAVAAVIVNRVEEHPAFGVYSQAPLRTPAGYSQFVSAVPEADGEMCQRQPAGGHEQLVSLVQQEARAAATADIRPSVALERPPVRVIRDMLPTYSAVAVDVRDSEIVLQDENLFQIMVYDRLSNTPPTATLSEPKRVIGGPDTQVEFNCGLYIDPLSGDIYSINNDTLDAMTIFPRSARGNAVPERVLHTPHGTYGIAVDEDVQEIYLTVQHQNEVVVYRKMAQGDEKPLRTLQGPQVKLADPHGIALDTKDKLLFVSNYGNARNPKVAGTGTFVSPSIAIYPMKASGDTSPLRTIEGSNTQMNWPAHISVDEARGELYVANDGDDSILVFRIADEGNVAPTRVLKGPRTQLKNPTGVFFDKANNEVVVSNMGNHSATVYARGAQGDTPPLRTIRSGAADKSALMIGNPGSVAYDTKRDTIIVPNCVAHPQIAIFPRLANGSDVPERVIYGQASKLGRTMHAIRYNEVRDEFYVGNPLAQAVLTFRGGANGQEAPIRIIQGPHTMLLEPDHVEVDPVHDEIIVPQDDKVLVFPATANGDVAPIRVFRSPAKDGWHVDGGTGVDPIHNVIAMAGTVKGAAKAGYSSPYGDLRESLLIFDRTADGEVQPLRVIRGPHTGMHAIRQIEIQPKDGWIVIGQMTAGNIPEPKGTFIGVWNINDSGDLSPRWKIEGKPSNVTVKPRGIALDFKHKEVITADMRLNAILTFYFPEIF